MGWNWVASNSHIHIALILHVHIAHILHVQIRHFLSGPSFALNHFVRLLLLIVSLLAIAARGSEIGWLVGVPLQQTENK